MPTILHIETSTEVCSAALSENGKILTSHVCREGMSHATKLPVFVDELLNFCRQNGSKIDAVAVSAGPGSYTGLRIGVSTAKGLCYGLGCPLLAIDTLAVMAAAAQKLVGEIDALVCPMIDARRMEVYTAFFAKNVEKIVETEAKIVDSESFSDELNRQKIYFCGNGSAKCQPVILHKNAAFLPDVVPLAENMVALAEHQFANEKFENVAYFEPFYLKEFQPTTPKLAQKNDK